MQKIFFEYPEKSKLLIKRHYDFGGAIAAIILLLIITGFSLSVLYFRGELTDVNIPPRSQSHLWTVIWLFVTYIIWSLLRVFNVVDLLKRTSTADGNLQKITLPFSKDISFSQVSSIYTRHIHRKYDTDTYLIAVKLNDGTKHIFGECTGKRTKDRAVLTLATLLNKPLIEADAAGLKNNVDDTVANDLILKVRYSELATEILLRVAFVLLGAILIGVMVSAPLRILFDGSRDGMIIYGAMVISGLPIALWTIHTMRKMTRKITIPNNDRWIVQNGEKVIHADDLARVIIDKVAKGNRRYRRNYYELKVLNSLLEKPIMLNSFKTYGSALRAGDAIADRLNKPLHVK